MLTIEQVKDKLALIEAAERIRAEVDSVSDDAPSNRTYWVFLEPGPYEAWKRGDDAKLSLSFRTTDLARLALSLSERLAAAEALADPMRPMLIAKDNEARMDFTLLIPEGWEMQIMGMHIDTDKRTLKAMTDKPVFRLARKGEVQ